MMRLTEAMIPYFNPRSREGSDDNLCVYNRSSVYFNPRSREGSDFIARRQIEHDVRFQSTLPRGERPQIHTNN